MFWGCLIRGLYENEDENAIFGRVSISMGMGGVYWHCQENKAFSVGRRLLFLAKFQARRSSRALMLESKSAMYCVIAKKPISVLALSDFDNCEIVGYSSLACFG